MTAAKASAARVRHGDQRRAARRPAKSTTTCQLHMRLFNDGDEITIEPWRAAAFPVDARSGRGSQLFGPRDPGRRLHLRCARARPSKPMPCQSRSSTRIRRSTPPRPARAAAPAWRPARMRRPRFSRPPRSRTWRSCPQGTPERADRVRKMVAQMDAEGFGHCSSHKECEAVCPKDISISFIAKMNRELL